MRFRNYFLYVPLWLAFLFMLSCGSDNNNNNQQTEVNTTATPPNLTVGVRPLATPANMPLVQGGAWAVQGNQLLLIGGRRQGYHGLAPEDSIFSQTYANRNIYVINLQDYSSQSLALDSAFPQWQPLCASSMEFFQDGDTLYIVGGYGTKQAATPRSNFTFPTLFAISVSQMIAQVQSGGDPQKAVLATAQSPWLKVTGGELFKAGSTFYLMFGQNFDGLYDPGKTGTYTSAVRSFTLDGNQIIPGESCIDSSLHRRDLNAVAIVQQSGTFYAGLGGVFTADDDGYEQPVYYYPGSSQCNIVLDTLHQMTNQYNCSRASLYDAASNTHFTILMGGIGEYQYLAGGGWRKGDRGDKLPFVRTITQMIYRNGFMQQHIQLPPGEPTMPSLVGANAIFIPNSSILYSPGVIDCSKLNADSTSIGIIYGGILSQRPSSSLDFPTRVNPTVYEVVVWKGQGAGK